MLKVVENSTSATIEKLKKRAKGVGSERLVGTISGKLIDINNPQPEDIILYDIAHSLSMQRRFNGHTIRAYSVAEHSMLVADILEARGYQPDVILAGLMHDSHEAYLGDTIKPVKGTVRDETDVLYIMELDLDEAIRDGLNLGADAWGAMEIHQADHAAYQIEAAQLCTWPTDIDEIPLDLFDIELPAAEPTDLVREFIIRFNHLKILVG